MTATFSLDEVVAEMRLEGEMKDPAGWLTRQILTGRIKARKIGRSWRMTRSDIDAAIEVWATKAKRAAAPRVQGEEPVQRTGISAASQARRLRSAS